jgi:hypothetical protein
LRSGDAATFIPMVATKLAPSNMHEAYLIRAVGWGEQNPIFFYDLETTPRIQARAYNWNNNRTRTVAHEYIEKNFDNLKSGQVIDVEFIMGLSKEPKQSQLNDRINEEYGNDQTNEDGRGTEVGIPVKRTIE